MATREVLTCSHWGAYRVTVEDGAIRAVRPFEEDCSPSPLIEALPQTVHSPLRIRTPAVRAGYLRDGPASPGDQRGREPFVAVTWERAFDLLERELRRIRDTYGPEAVYGGSPGWASAGRFHHPATHLKRFLTTLGGYTDGVGGYSFGAGLILAPHVIGTAAPVFGLNASWDGLAAHCELFVAIGGLPVKNTQVDMGGSGTHDAADRLRALRARGTEFVYVGPWLGDDAMPELEAQWLAARPNTDAALMLGLAHTLEVEGLADRDFLARHCVGYERFRAYLLGEAGGPPRDAQWAAGITEIPAHTICDLARRMARRRTLLAVSWSAQRGDHGEQAYWVAIALAAMLGQIGLPGGGFGFGYAAGASIGTARHPFMVPRPPVPKNPTGKLIPYPRISDMLLNPGAPFEFNGRHLTYPDIHLVWLAGGNPFHQHQEINKLLRAWYRPDTVVVNDSFWSSAARHADIVLPVATTLERADIGSSATDPYVIAMQQALAPHGESRTDFDLFAALAARFGTAETFTEGLDETGWLRRLYGALLEQARPRGVALPEFDAFWERGHVRLPDPDRPYVPFAEFRADPAANPLKTASGRIEIYCETIAGFGYDDCPGHPAWLEPAEWLGGAQAARYPLHLMSNQPPFRLHSQMDHAPLSRRHKVHGREPVWINRDDAAARGIAEGDIVRVYNDRGACLAGARLTERIRRGVINLSTGAWYDPDRPGPGALCKHGNPNVLTLDKGTSRLAQSTSATTTLVEVERFAGEPPPVTAHEPPEILDRLEG
jgi:biotin/methionine sulfoxide reductase